MCTAAAWSSGLRTFSQAPCWSSSPDSFSELFFFFSLFARQSIYLSTILTECWQLWPSASSGPSPSITFSHYACSAALAFNGCSEHLYCPCLSAGSSNSNSSSNTKKICNSAHQQKGFTTGSSCWINRFAVRFIEFVRRAVSRFYWVVLRSYCTL